MTLFIVVVGPGRPPPKYPVFGEGVAPSLNLTAGADGAGFVTGVRGNAFALALDAAKPKRATLNAAPGTAAVVSDA